jgi:plasmid stabilization system protein ParE
MIVRIREEAEGDLEAAFDWYEAQRPDLGHEFLEAFLRALSAVAEAPRRWPEHPKVTKMQRHRLHRFPFAIAYRVETTHCMIFAVEDLRRTPGYWSNRLK